MKKTLLTGILGLILVLTPGQIFTQVDKNGGSLYSIFGLGELNYSGSNRTDGMGIMGIGLYGDYTNTLNPAAWSRIQNTIFTTRFNMETIKSTDGTNLSNRTYGNFEGFNLSVPLNKGNGWIFDLGINNYSIVNYDAKFQDQTSSGENYTQYYSGNGGLYRLSVGFSYLIFRYFSFGAQFNYGFGNINRDFNIDFVNGLLYDTKYSSSNTISGFYFNTGLVFHGFGKLFQDRKFNNLTLGAFISTPGKFDSELSGKFGRSIINTDTVSLGEGSLDIPFAFGVGISNIFNEKLVLAADFFMQQWDNYKYYGTHPDKIKNSMKIGLGMEYTPSERFEDGFFSRVSYRLGASYTADYLRINGQNINILEFSAGLSLPITKHNAIDLFFKYNTKGKDSDGLIKDEVLRFGASIKIGELWFLRPSDEF
jgi:hypothetical protein